MLSCRYLVLRSASCVLYISSVDPNRCRDSGTKYVERVPSCIYAGRAYFPIFTAMPVYDFKFLLVFMHCDSSAWNLQSSAFGHGRLRTREMVDLFVYVLHYS